ncbi:MAG: hypothetical protein PHE33_04245 [Bacteroidales bacterium]|nr:hypothetical protein [Bacteroidales bacterium]
MYIFEPLVKKVENYIRTSIELYKLKTINISADLLSTIISRGLVVVPGFAFFATLNIGLSLWLGDMLGKIYYGFFGVAAFYGIVGVIVYLFMKKFIKKQIRESFISHLQN